MLVRFSDSQGPLRVFVLCGSSARKLRRSSANLLGGRSDRYELHGLVSAEVGDTFDLVRMLNHGYLPPHYLADSPGRSLRAYVENYLKEEILAEGLTRNVSSSRSMRGRAARRMASRSCPIEPSSGDCGMTI